MFLPRRFKFENFLITGQGCLLQFLRFANTQRRFLSKLLWKSWANSYLAPTLLEKYYSMIYQNQVDNMSVKEIYQMIFFVEEITNILAGFVYLVNVIGRVFFIFFSRFPEIILFINQNSNIFFSWNVNFLIQTLHMLLVERDIMTIKLYINQILLCYALMGEQFRRTQFVFC